MTVAQMIHLCEPDDADAAQHRLGEKGEPVQAIFEDEFQAARSSPCMKVRSPPARLGAPRNEIEAFPLVAAAILLAGTRRLASETPSTDFTMLLLITSELVLY